MKKELKFGKEATDALYTGLRTAARAVSGTIGPKGRNVLIGDPMMPRLTNDGVSIAGKIMLADPYEDAGAWIVRTAAARANDEGGDGTTTTVVVTEALAEECLNSPVNPMLLKASLEATLPAIAAEIKKVAHKTTPADVKRIARISAENEEIAELVSTIIAKKGEDALVLVEDSPTSSSFIELVDGYEAKVGFMSPYFITNPATQRAEYKEVAVFCSHKKIGTIGDIKPLYDQLDAANITQLVIVCDEIEMGVLGTIVNSKLKGMFNTLVIRATGELLDDIAAATGATQVSEQTGISFGNIDIKKHLGRAKTVVSDQRKTLFVSSAKSADLKATQLITQSKNVESELEKASLKKRASKLRGGVAVLRIGTINEANRGYLKDKAEDAVKAVKAALAEGYVEGGGMTLYRIAERMKPTSVGEEILKRALTAPLRKIIENGGEDYATIVKNLPAGHGYDAKNSTYVDLIKVGIIDPAKIERVAVESAIGAVASLITTHAVIVDAPEPTK